MQKVRWEHTDPSGATYAQTGYNGLMYYDNPAELDPLGSNVGLSNPYDQSNIQQAGPGGWGYGSWGDPYEIWGEFKMYKRTRSDKRTAGKINMP